MDTISHYLSVAGHLPRTLTWLRQQRWFIKAKQEQDRREKIDEKLEDDFAALASEVVIATEVQMREFETKLDHYDEATVIALMENQEILDRLYAEREALLARAFVMDDGRRVFKSEDGSFVIDEFGELVGPEELDPDLIAEHFPTAQEFSGNDDAILEAEEAQARLYEIQAKVDEAREDLSDGEITVEQMAEYDAELMGLVPGSAKGHFTDIADDEPSHTLRSEFEAPAALPKSLMPASAIPSVDFGFQP